MFDHTVICQHVPSLSLPLHPNGRCAGGDMTGEKEEWKRLGLSFRGGKEKKQGKNIFPLHLPSPFFFARLFFPIGRGVRELSGEAEKILTLITLSSEAPSLWRCERPSWGAGGTWNWSEDSFEESTEASETERMGWCQRSPVRHRAWNYRRKQFGSQQSWCVGLARSSYWDSKEYHVFKIKPWQNSTFPKVQTLSADVWSHLAARTFVSLEVGRARRRALPGAHVERLRAEQKKRLAFSSADSPEIVSWTWHL